MALSLHGGRRAKSTLDFMERASSSPTIFCSILALASFSSLTRGKPYRMQVNSSRSFSMLDVRFQLSPSCLKRCFYCFTYTAHSMLILMACFQSIDISPCEYFTFLPEHTMEPWVLLKLFQRDYFAFSFERTVYIIAGEYVDPPRVSGTSHCPILQQLR